MTFRIVPGLADFAENYEAYILDLWGVVHNGLEPYPGVLECMAKLRENGRKILLLSNAPRTSNFVQDFLENIGVDRDVYDLILTSGDMTRMILEDKRFPYLEGESKAFYQFGAERDKGLEDGLDYRKVDKLAEADFVICTGLADDETETPEHYRALLTEAAEYKLPMICANPDLTVMRGVNMHYCAGSLAQLYETLGGEVTLFGKPYPWAYKLAMEKLDVSDPSKILAVGDSMRTDIKGATGAGIDCVLVSGGIHAEEWGLVEGDIPTNHQVEDLVSQHGIAPTFVTGHMIWA
ncbi:TIGR01459 family HAD-type hydrolase [Sneathiella limimaris]|uniref:TIGR01459 family HAD-type hydrolase n=1 Tax=Sneathiella limimaris TaxID=1964213 RepID=UPI00146A3BAB|nr:TIGR01459 family HAD-type hydrolase [Sneathiella limimaris]